MGLEKTEISLFTWFIVMLKQEMRCISTKSCYNDEVCLG